MTEAIETWVSAEAQRKQMMDHTMAIHQASIHQAELHALQARQLLENQETEQARVQHSLISLQHVDVDA